MSDRAEQITLAVTLVIGTPIMFTWPWWGWWLLEQVGLFLNRWPQHY
jgi:hypothetical protein